MHDAPNESHLEFGDPDGFPILYCHGTPGSAAECAFADTAARKHHLRLIAPDRPGYGDTPPALAMSYAECAQSSARFLNTLGITRYGVLGVSGGAPIALALAAADPAHIAGVTLVSALGPFAEPELAKSAGLLARLMRAGATRNLGALDRMVLSPLATIGRAIPLAAQAFMQLHHAAPDRRCLGRPEIKHLLALSLNRAFNQGSAGVKRDFRLMVKPWEIPLTEINTPVKLWHGLADGLLSAAHSQWLAQHLPHADLELVEGEGHFSLPFDHADRILRELAERCPRNMNVSAD